MHACALMLNGDFSIFNMAEKVQPCVDENEFLRQLEELKEHGKTQKYSINVYVSDEFYLKAQNFLKIDETKNYRSANNQVTKSEVEIIRRKKWMLDANDNIITAGGKSVLCKSQLFKNLVFAHQRVAHRGRQKTEKWMQDSFAEVTQKVINLFVKLCKYHAEQKPITSRVKEVTKPFEALTKIPRFNRVRSNGFPKNAMQMWEAPSMGVKHY
ncbi:uncharacterized protein LOC114576288 [Exaiptasia diaphana]|uniref:Uncharacterized protein n=1 Tax=Exaiptasia diaphana TaxID=2652724 RepID=A0A913YTM9_EXADI|nr:uncharacterized protein LOC114576288 [Exaiptasia diaphana]